MTGRAQVDARASLTASLEAVVPEIEQAILVRACSIADPSEIADPSYLEGLRAAVSAAVASGLSALKGEGDQDAPVPGVLLEQARLAARNDVSLDTVLRRYFAGQALLGNFLIEAATESNLMEEVDLRRLLGLLAGHCDRLVSVVSDEYARELSGRFRSPELRRLKAVTKLLSGESVDASVLAYDFDAVHIGLIVAGPRAQGEKAVRALAAAMDRRLMSIPPDEQTVWAWLGGRQGLSPDRLLDRISRADLSGLRVAVGEPGRGLPGWRRTHHQAATALPLAIRIGERRVRYLDVALSASMLKDDLLAASLRDLYIAPLAAGPEGGAALRETLRAYFAADRNLVSTAAALGVHRQTVAKRLREIEQRLPRPLSVCALEVEAALRLDEVMSTEISPLGS